MLRLTEKDRGPTRVPERAWMLLAIVAAVVSLMIGGLGRWIGFALVLAIAPRLLGPILRVPAIADRREQIARWLPILLVIGLGLTLLGDLLLGRPPVSRDHGIHYFQTKILVDELIPRGELIGWSDRLNTGYPFGDSYPVLGYLITGAANLLSFGLISLRTSYAWGLLAVWALALGAVWWLAATIASELQGEPDHPGLLDPRWAGAFAAIAWLIDPGAAREGGWNYLMFHGVWPQLLSSALWVASLPATWAALRRPSPRSLGLASLLLGASVLAHPFGMLTVAVSAVAWPIVLWATGVMRTLLGGQIRWWLIIHVVAGLICAGYVVTFLASADAMSRSPVPYEPLGSLATRLLAGELFRDHRAWIGPLSVIGIIVAIRRGRAMAWLGVGLVCALLVLASQASITVLRLDLVVSAFKNLQFPRYAIALKPVLYAFTGIGAAVLVARLRELPDRDQPANADSVPRPVAARLIACLCLAPLVVGIIDDRGRLLPRPVGGVEVLEGSVHAAPEQALRETLLAEAALLAEAEDPRRLTVAFLRRGMGGGTYPLFSITDADAKLVMDGHIPAVNYKHQVRRRSPAALDLLGVTHVLHDRPLAQSNDDLQLVDRVEVVGEFGVWTLARVLPANNPRAYVASGKVGEVELARGGVTELQVGVEGPGRVDIPIAPYRKWRAVRSDGEPVKLAPVSLIGGVPGTRLSFADADTLTLSYQAPTHERVAGWLSLAVIVLVLAGLASRRELSLAVRLESARASRISWALGLLTLAVVLVGGYFRQERKLAQTWSHVLDAHGRSERLGKGRALRFREDLIDAGAYSVVRSNTDGCDGTLGKDAMAGCSQAHARPRVSMVFRAPYLYRCLRVEVPARGSLDITLHDLRDDDDLAGFYVREGPNLDGVELRLPGADEFRRSPDQAGRQHFHVTADARGGGDQAKIELRNAGARAHALCFAMAAATSVQ
ncbi:MAG TPA: hypothetical protein VK034_21370 [Enhygromyxa sp.]|nr:hypothetical protein [Enhygromyxa sp.]